VSNGVQSGADSFLMKSRRQFAVVSRGNQRYAQPEAILPCSARFVVDRRAWCCPFAPDAIKVHVQGAEQFLGESVAGILGDRRIFQYRTGSLSSLSWPGNGTLLRVIRRRGTFRVQRQSASTTGLGAEIIDTER
jgi:hypothetical protein